MIGLDRFILWLSRRWVLVISAMVGLYAGIPFMAPVAMHMGWTGVGDTIYRVYSPVCHQFAFRSWFLYGDQTVYPRQRAGVAGGTFEQYASQEPAFAGIDVNTLGTDLIYAAKRFRGSDQADRDRTDRAGWVQPVLRQPAFQRFRAGVLPRQGEHALLEGADRLAVRDGERLAGLPVHRGEHD
ncbi:MAG: hypothetical protein P8Z40_17880 [Chloroflexota bacterium]